MSKCTALIKFFSFCVIFEPLLWLSALSLFSWFPWASKNHPLPPPPLPPSPLLSRLVLLRTCDMTLHKFHFLGNKKPFPTLFFAANQPKEIFSFFEVKDDFRLFKRSDDGQKTKAAPKTKINSAKFLPTLLSPTQAPTKTPPERETRKKRWVFFRAPRQEGEEVWEEQKTRFFLPSEVNENKRGRLGGRGPLLSSLELEKCLFLAPSPPSLSSLFQLVRPDPPPSS